MRITHVTDFYLPRLGGIEMHVHDLAERQRAAGHVVTIVTATPPAPGGDPREAECGGVCDVRAPFRVARAVTAGKADVVHVHAGVWTPSAFAAGLAAQASGVPTVVTYHSLLSWALPIYRCCNTVVRLGRRRLVWSAVSDVAAQPLRTLLPGQAARIRVLPNAVDRSDWVVTPVDRDPAEVVLVSVMRLAARKRPRQLVRMLQEVVAGVPADVRVRAVIVGDGPARPRLERLVDRLGLRDVITFLGRVDRPEIRRLYARADVFVAPTVHESFGIAALEARCAGLPVVAMASTGIRAFVHHGETGLLCADDAAMVAAVTRLAAQPALRAELSARSRAQPPAFGWDDAIRACDEAYADAATVAARESLRCLGCGGRTGTSGRRVPSRTCTCEPVPKAPVEPLSR